MILYFYDRFWNPLGKAASNLPKGIYYTDDKQVDNVESGTSTFEFYLEFDTETRDLTKTYADESFYIVAKDEDEETRVWQIIDDESDEEAMTRYFYCEDAGMDLINETLPAWQEPSAAQKVAYYINKAIYDSGFEIGNNEIDNLTRTLSWDSEATALARLQSILAQFDNAEFRFRFVIDENTLELQHKYIDIYQKVGSETGVKLRYGREVKNIKVKRSKANLVNAYRCYGATPSGKNAPINLTGYTLSTSQKEINADTGKARFVLSGNILKDTESNAKYSRYLNPNEQGEDLGYYTGIYQGTAQTQKGLADEVIRKLKQTGEPEVSYEVELLDAPRTLSIGDTVYVVNDADELYLEGRILQIERSRANDTFEITLGDYLVQSSGVNAQLQALADQIASLNASKNYNYTISTTNGWSFKNSEGSTTLSAVIRDNIVDVTDVFAIEWYKDGVKVATSAILAVNASDISGKAVYKYLAKNDDGEVAGRSEVTITNVDDGKDGQKGEKGDQGDKGSDGAPGKDGVGIKSTAITYQLGSSGTTAPTGSWQNNVPTLTQGKYLWTRTIWTYTDNTNETGYSATYIAKDGNDGSDGIAGKDGVGITSTSFLYAQSTSGTTAPSSGWSTSIPSVPAGSYLWTKTSWNYTDGTTESAYTVSLMGKTGATGATGAQGPKGDTGASGKDGVAGKDGVGISDTTIQYASSASGTTKPTSGWQSTIPSVSAGNYLWTRTTLTYSDASSEDIYSVSRIGKDGNKGDDGIAGKDGVGLSSTTINYAASTSGTTKPTSGWSTTIPSVAAGSYLWTRTVWTYTDNTSEAGYSVAMMGKSGVDGVAGKDGVGIKSTAVTYGSSTSGTTAPTSGYTTTVPNVAKGSYLWTKTVWTYTDNSTETGYSVAYMGTNGNNGTNGVAGKDGVGITSTTITYAASTSGTSAPTSGYTTSVPSVDEGSFLWTKTTWTYTDGTNETGYSVAKQGAKGSTGATGAQGPKGDTGASGAKGADGKGVKSTDITYAASTSGTSAPSSGYSTTIPSVAAGSFLWTKSVMTYTDNSTSTFYSVGKMGSNGATGATGPKGDSTGIISAASAPTTDLYVGKLYLNTTNGITYRYTGSSWAIWSIKAAMMDVDKLSAIIANLGDITAGSFMLPFSYTESGITFTGTLSIKDGSLFIKRTASTGAYWETSIDYRTGVTDTYYPTNKNTTTDVKFAALRAGKMLLMDSGVGGYLPAEALSKTPWTNLTYNSGFTTAENNPCQYRIYYQLDGSKLIRLRGQFAKTSGNMATGSNYPFQFPASGGANFIPTEIRPDRTEMGYGATNTGDGGRLAVTPAGIFIATPASACTYMGISGLQYIID